MGCVFHHGEIARLLRHFNMKKRKNGFIYEGTGRDGKWRSAKFDYHKDRDVLRKGTALNIAQSLGFATLEEMKDYYNSI